MFDFITDVVENAIDVVTAPLYGELPTKRQVAKLIGDGLTIYAISQMTGVAVEVLEKLMEDN